MTPELESGARNLLLQCADVKTGERLLLIGEKGLHPFFDYRLCDVVAEVARSLRIETTVHLAVPGTDASEFPESVSNAMQNADVTIFFSRLGDQVRFIDSAGPGRKIMTYTLTLDHLESKFSTFDFQLMKQIHDTLLEEVKASKTYLIESDNGTSLKANVSQISGSSQVVVSEFSLELFPVMIFPPLNFSNLNGQLVMEHFLLSSSTRTYEDSELHLDSPVTAVIEDSRMVDFKGNNQLIDKLKMQLIRAAAITGGDPYRLNSWHTGINPYTFYDSDPFSNLERWGTVAYGSPRYTHIHASGKDPGDISIQLFDASITFDDKRFWEQGKFIYLDQPEIQSIFSHSIHAAPDSSTRLSIGL